VLCNVGAGGSGGDGGAGGAGQPCDWTGEQICSLGREADTSIPVEACENEFDECLLRDLGGNECEKCVGRALSECRD